MHWPWQRPKSREEILLESLHHKSDLHSRALTDLLKGQDKIMATFEDLMREIQETADAIGEAIAYIKTHPGNQAAIDEGVAKLDALQKSLKDATTTTVDPPVEPPTEPEDPQTFGRGRR